jgi:hypothetical protein
MRAATGTGPKLSACDLVGIGRLPIRSGSARGADCPYCSPDVGHERPIRLVSQIHVCAAVLTCELLIFGNCPECEVKSFIAPRAMKRPLENATRVNAHGVTCNSPLTTRHNSWSMTSLTTPCRGKCRCSCRKVTVEQHPFIKRRVGGVAELSAACASAPDFAARRGAVPAQLPAGASPTFALLDFSALYLGYFRCLAFATTARG